MEITIKIRDEVFHALEKVADLDNRPLDDAIGEAIRIYLQGSFDELLGDFFSIDPEKPNCPILE